MYWITALQKLRNWDRNIFGSEGKENRAKQTGKKVYIVGKKSVNVDYVVNNKGRKRKLITVKDLGRKAVRQDDYGRTKRTYKYVKWNSELADLKKQHKSHLPEGSKIISLQGQKCPGRCLLCPKQGMFITQRLMDQHYLAVHHKSSIKFQNLILLRCKCSEVRSRGRDSSTRNAHYHCTICHKPCDYSHQLAKHLVSKHDFEPEDVDNLIQPVSKGK